MRRNGRMKVFDRERPILSRQEIPLARREFLKGITSLGALALLSYFIPACSEVIEPAPAELLPGVGMVLPEPRKESDVSIEEALLKRRSIRTYKREALTLEEVSQLLWAAQGTTSGRGFRTAPSASALYPLETYIVVGDVANLDEGVYHYETRGHKLEKVLEGDYRPRLTRNSMGWYFVEGGAIYIVFTAIYERTTSRAGDEEGKKYVHMEVGHAAQNVYLQAVSLGLGTVVIGGFSSSRAREILQLPENETPLYFMPVGRI
jgi:SagB-type dehydrogenase family enzyme